MATPTDSDLTDNTFNDDSLSKPLNDNVDEIKMWVETLPLNDPIVTAESIYQYLRNMQDKAFSPEEQFEILDLFEPIIRFLWHALPKLYLGMTNTPYKDKGHIIFVCNGIESSAINAYAMLITVLTKTAVTTHHKLFHALLVYRTFYHLTHILINYYQLSAKPPEMIWRKFHKLYNHADRYGLLKIDLASDFTAPTTGATIENAYKHALLLSTGDPFKLRFYEIEKLHQALYSWASMVFLVPDTQSALFSIHLDSDFPPRYNILSDAPLAEKGILGLDTRHLAEHMEDILLKRADTDLTKRILETLSKSLIEHLHKIWSQTYTRKFPRKNAEGEMLVCLGLYAVHAMLSGENIFDMRMKPMQAKNNDQQITAMSIEKKPAETRDLLPFEMHKNHSRHSIYEWKISNKAPEGFCLVSMGEEKEIIQPTEIVLLKNVVSGTHLPWQLGILRWVMREEENDIVKVGVETLSVNARAIKAKINKDATGVHGILFPTYESNDFSVSVILPPTDCKEGDNLFVFNDQLEYEIKLVRMVSTNMNLNYFNAVFVKAIKEDITLTHEAAQHPYSGKNTSDIWENI